jgi:hypothetical protein
MEARLSATPGGSPNALAFAKLAIFAVWLSSVLFLTIHHAMWRDEVRALSLALRGDDVVGMWKAIHGEGHPALWYLMLRGAHAVVASPLVLNALALGIAIAIVALLLVESPFPWPLIVLILAGHGFVYEYAVMARNYGVAVLMLFALAACYRRFRDRGIVLGLLLFVLANCNVHAAMLAGAFLVFWFGDILATEGRRWSPAWKTLVLNAAIAGAGLVVCALTIFPPVNDAALKEPPFGQVLGMLWDAAIHPERSFLGLIGFLTIPDFFRGPLGRLFLSLSSILRFGPLLGLVRRPSALVAALLALIGLSAFFAVGVAGSYRHQGEWLAFVVAMYWISWPEATRSAVPGGARPILARIGVPLFLALLAVQAVQGIVDLASALGGGPPESRIADFAAFVRGRADLKDAVLIADPDYLLEAAPYYLDNPTYLTRGGGYANVVVFSRKARLDLTLDDLTRQAVEIRDASGKPVVILVSHALDEIAPDHVYREGYDWTFSASSRQIQSFRDATSLLGRFRPASGDESFDAYLLNSNPLATNPR